MNITFDMVKKKYLPYIEAKNNIFASIYGQNNPIGYIQLYNAYEFPRKNKLPDLPNDHLWLFGSRVDFSKKGGDIDLYIETNAQSVDNAVKMQSDFIINLKSKIGEQKIDVIINMFNFPHHLVIHDVARKEEVMII